MDEAKEVIQERNLLRLIKNGAFKFTDTFFPYTSGEIGPYYVSSEVVQADGHDYWGAIGDMEDLILDIIPKQEIDIISGGESRDWVFSFPIAADFAKPHFMIYKDGSVKGGTNVRDANVVHVADLSNEGSSPKNVWVPTIRKNGGTINDIFFYVDRMEEGVKVMERLGLRSHAVVPLDQNAWDYLSNEGVINAGIYKNLRERGTSKEERDAWALRMLKSDEGMKTLKELAETNPEKVRKILNHPAYAEIKDIIRIKESWGEFFDSLLDFMAQ